MMLNAVHHKGWSNVTMGFAMLWRCACSDTNFRVEETQVTSLGFISIIGRKVIDDFPLWLPWWITCIIPAQAGRIVSNSRDVFHSTSKFAVGSSALATTTSLYFISACASLGSDGGWISTFPAAEIFWGLTFRLGTQLVGLVPGVTVAIMPMP